MRATASRLFSRAAAYIFTGRRRHLVTVGLVLFTLLVIGTILTANWTTLAAFEWQLRPIWLLAGLLFLLGNFGLNAWIWHLLSARLVNYNNARFNIKVWCYANLMRRIPGTVWFIASRAALYEQIGVSKLRISLLSGLELALILAAGLVTGLLTLPFLVLPAAYKSNLATSWLLIPVLIGAALLMHPRVLGALWHRLTRDKMVEQLRWGDTLRWVGLFVIAWILGGFTLFSTINLVHPLPSSNFAAILAIWVVANTVSVAGALTIGGFGLREISLTVLLSQFVPTPVALVISLLMRLIWLVAELIGALVSLIL